VLSCGKKGDSLPGCYERGNNILVFVLGGKFPDQLGYSDVIKCLIREAQNVMSYLWSVAGHKYSAISLLMMEC
jgi:hypothetical protein